MNEKIEAILEKPLQIKLAIYFGTLALLAGGYWYLFYSSSAEQLQGVVEKNETLKSEIAQQTGVVANLDKFREAVKRLDGELQRAIAELPDKRETERLLSRVSDKARDAGLEVRLFQPAADVVQDFYAEVPVDLEVRGTYHQLGSFFDEVAHLSRIVNIRDFDFGTPTVDDQGMMITGKLNIFSFRFLDESERVVPADGKGKGKGKGAPKKPGKEE